MNTSPFVFVDMKFSIVSNQINNNFVLFLLHAVNLGDRNTWKTYKTKNKKKHGGIELKNIDFNTACKTQSFSFFPPSKQHRENEKNILQEAHAHVSPKMFPLTGG